VSSEASGETDYLADFSALKTEGTYTVKSGSAESYPFEIKKGVYDEALKAALKMLYVQRCGTDLPESLAGDFAHPACHTGDAIIYGTDQKKDVSGGWHDAGDYGRYVVSGAKAVADLLFSYQDFSKALQGDDYGIPESGNGVPDILDEARYELNWMLKMQDASGGVYHKVTGLAFPGEVMPQDETAQLYILPISNTATGDFAAVMAMSYNVYKYIDSKFADQCLAAAKKAWDYLEAHGAGNFKNPADVLTGEYSDGNDNDERYWAAAALYRATGDQKYLEKFKWIAWLYTQTLDGYGWQSVGGYGNKIYLSLSPKVTDPKLVQSIKDAMKDTADEYLKNASSDGYGSSLGMSYPWGSNMTICDNANYLYLASGLFGNANYKAAADRSVGYIFGENPMATCYVTGLGTVSPVSTHHRPSMATGKVMPGMLVGGPDSSLEDPYAKAVLVNRPPAKCYADNAQSFSTNEVAVYWNTALIYLLAHKLS
jgi:endoglucanase